MTLRLFRQQALRGFLLLSILLLGMLSTVQAQDINVCRDGAVTDIEYGDSLTGTLNDDFPIQFFCFEGERGDEITVTVAPTEGNLLTAVLVSSPFLSAEGALADEPLAEATASPNTGNTEATATLTEDGTFMIIVQAAPQTTGSFTISLEVSEGAVLGSGGIDLDDEDTDDADDEDEDDEPDLPTSTDDTTQIVPGETDLCELNETIEVEIGETSENTLSSDGFPSFACFDAEVGDIVNIEVTTTDGDATMGFIITTPFYNFSETATTFGQGFVESSDDVATTEFFVREAGTYLLIILATNGEDGSFSLTVDLEAGTLYSCENEPLNMLIDAEWGILDADTDAPLIELNIGCADLMAVSALGGSDISVYNVEQDGTFIFAYQERLFTTVSLSEDEWVVTSDTGEEYTFVPLSDADACSDEFLSSLIRGSWEWAPAPNQTIIFDFTCNGTVIIDINGEDRFATPYEFDGDEEITIELGGGETLVMEDIDLDPDELDVEIENIDYDLRNRLYEEPEEEDTDG